MKKWKTPKIKELSKSDFFRLTMFGTTKSKPKEEHGNMCIIAAAIKILDNTPFV